MEYKTPIKFNTNQNRNDIIPVMYKNGIFLANIKF